MIRMAGGRGETCPHRFG